MNRAHERLLAATLAGIVITVAAALAVQPAMAAGYDVGADAEVTDVEYWDVLNVRKWPASYSKKTGELQPDAVVWVERCIVAEFGSDWCLVEGEGEYGWVNSRYLAIDEFEDDYAELDDED